MQPLVVGCKLTASCHSASGLRLRTSSSVVDDLLVYYARPHVKRDSATCLTFKQAASQDLGSIKAGKQAGTTPTYLALAYSSLCLAFVVCVCASIVSALPM